jgi:hypothetical protein
MLAWLWEFLQLWLFVCWLGFGYAASLIWISLYEGLKPLDPSIPLFERQHQFYISPDQYLAYQSTFHAYSIILVGFLTWVPVWFFYVKDHKWLFRAED